MCRLFAFFLSLRRSLPLSLTTVLLGAVLLPFVIAMVLVGGYSIHLLEQHTRVRMQEDIELIARAIRLPLSHAMERGHEGTVRQALESAFSIDRVYGIYVYDTDGTTIYASGTGGATMTRDRAKRIANQQERQGEFGRAGEVPVFSYFVPLVDTGERVSGLLQITRRGSDFDDYLTTVRRHSLTIMTLAGLMLAGVILLGHRWGVGRHLRRVEAGLTRIRAGEREHRLEGGGPRELQVLCVGINDMLDAIETSDSELEQQKAREISLTERLHQSRKLAALGQLAAGVAHELGSPLSTLDGKAQRALRQPQLQPTVKDALLSIRNQAARMEHIIRQLLDFGRTNPLDRRPVPADLPLRTVLQMLADTTGDAITVQLQLTPSVSRTRIRVDRVRLEQALANLLRNAVQAAQTRVRVSCLQESTGLRYCFEDDGPGISSEVRPRLFEPFFTTKAVGQGTGLGLAVAHAAARDHGGSIEIDTSELGGARFCLLLPAEEVPQNVGPTPD